MMYRDFNKQPAVVGETLYLRFVRRSSWSSGDAFHRAVVRRVSPSGRNVIAVWVRQDSTEVEAHLIRQKDGELRSAASSYQNIVCMEEQSYRDMVGEALTRQARRKCHTILTEQLKIISAQLAPMSNGHEPSEEAIGNACVAVEALRSSLAAIRRGQQ